MIQQSIKCFIIFILFFISCSTISFKDSSGSIETWENKRMTFRNSEINITDDYVVIKSYKKIKKDEIKTIYFIQDYKGD